MAEENVALTEQIEAEKKESELTDAEQKDKNLQEFLEGLKEDRPDAPTFDQVQAWKAQSGRVKLMMFSDDEVYFIRALKSGEYKAMVQQAQGQGKTPEQQNEILQDMVVCKATLWPVVDRTEMGALFAGTKDSLYTAVMQASNFLTPQEASMMVTEI